ncbi:MAG: hypothetical protein IPN08_15450 [Bacteroidales bacterium]|nr:hypothetical protein [Bacteroidales bacterium]
MRKVNHLILLLLLLFPVTLISQNKLYFIDKPTVAKRYKSVKAIYIVAEKDSNIGKFTTEFVNNLSSAFETKGIEVHKNFRTAYADPNLAGNRLDSILQNYDPNGIVILSFIGTSIMKTQIFGHLRPCYIFEFQYSYRENDSENFVHMYMTRFAVDIEKIDFAEPSTNDELIKQMTKKKVF